jgi:hypothetical protein
MKRAALFAVCLAAGALHLNVALADSAPLRVHGVVKQFDGQYLTMTADSGKKVVLGLQPATRIVRSRQMSLADIKSGDFVGTTAIRSADGTLRAQAIRVFPPDSPGMVEGQYSLEASSPRVVTNAVVSAVTSGPAGGTLSLTFHGAGMEGDTQCTGRAPEGGGGCEGTAELLIARGVPILAITTGDVSMLLPGAIVSAFATADATNLLNASSVTVEKDGKPAPAQ